MIEIELDDQYKKNLQGDEKNSSFYSSFNKEQGETEKKENGKETKKEDDTCQCCWCCCAIPKKSIYSWIGNLLIFMILPIIFSIFIYFWPFLWSNLFFFLPMWFSVSLVMFYLFPFFCRWLHVKPTYYEDLIDLEAQTKREQHRYEVVFEKFMSVPLALFVAALAYYCLHQIKNSTLRYFEIAGIVAGAFQGLKSFQYNMGSLFLKILHYKKSNQQQQRRTLTKSSYGPSISSF